MSQPFKLTNGSRHAPLRSVLAALGFLLFVAATTPAFAQSPDEDAPLPSREQAARPRRDDGDALLVRALNLSPAQRAEIARIRRETEQQGRAVGQRLRRARRALDEAIYAPLADESAVELRSREVAEAEAARVRLRAQTELSIRRLLTTEQLNVFRELRDRARAEQQRRQRQQRRAGADSAPRRLPRDRRALEPTPPSNPPAAATDNQTPVAPRRQRPAAQPFSRRQRLHPRP